MEKMFGSMMQGFFNGMSEEDKEKMKACCEKMAAMCPCGNTKSMPGKDKSPMMERMRSFCGDKMGMRSTFVQGE